MERIFVTSDTHFGHNQEFLYGKRGFRSADEMNRELVYRWNQSVREEDVVYHLGDVYLSGDENAEWLRQVNGHVRLIRGNHDTDQKVKRLLNSGAIESAVWADTLSYAHKQFYLGHFPTIIGDPNALEKGLRHRMLDLYGHTHQTTSFWNDRPFLYHVGVDSHDLAPVLLDQVIEDMKQKLAERSGHGR